METKLFFSNVLQACIDHSTEDVVEHLQTGYLANPFDPFDLAKGIKWILDDSDPCVDLGFLARQRAEKLWSYSRVSSLYQQVYHTVSGF